MRRSTGQATIELLVLCGLAAAVALALGTALASGAAAATAGALRRALRPPHPVHDDTWALGSPTWGPLLRRYAPRLVLERDRYGEDDEVPVEFTRCRQRPCARLGVGRPAMYVHLVRRPDAAFLHYWFYYPDSRTTHLPDGGLGTHADDWEGVIVRLTADGAAARATAHGGLAGSGPWWAAAPGWRPIGPHPVIYRASGSHANGFAPAGIDLAGDRWNGTLGTVDPALVAGRCGRPARGTASIPPRRRRGGSASGATPRRPAPASTGARAARSSRPARGERLGKGLQIWHVDLSGGIHALTLGPAPREGPVPRHAAAADGLRAAVPGGAVGLDRPRPRRAAVRAGRPVADRRRDRRGDPAARYRRG